MHGAELFHHRKILSSSKLHPLPQAPTLLALITMDQKANTYKLCINPSILGWFISIKVFISHKSCEAAITSILQTKTLSIKAIHLPLVISELGFRSCCS